MIFLLKLANVKDLRDCLMAQCENKSTDRYLSQYNQCYKKIYALHYLSRFFYFSNLFKVFFLFLLDLVI